MSTIGLSWPLSGGVGQLAPLSGDTDTRPHAANSDGSVLVGTSGQAGSPPTSGRAVRWNSLTPKALATVSGPTSALWLSRDVSIIEGSDKFEDNFTRWTSGGSAGALLTPPTGYTASQAPFFDQGLLPFQGRISSDDGTIIVGNSSGGTGGNPANTATVWTNGTPSTLPSSVGGTDISIAVGCSTSGLFVFGRQGNVATDATYWTGGTSHPLVGTVFNPDLQQVYLCDAAGTIIYGTVQVSLGVSQGCYWDSLGMLTMGRYGVLHLLDALPGGPLPTEIKACSETGNIVVGAATDSGGTVFATKWNGTTATNLGTAPGFQDSTATGCSADGGIVVGWARDIIGTFWPCYWDAGNVIHLLPTIADAGDSFQGIVLGISRDGTVAFGIGDTPSAPAPATLGIQTRGSLRRVQLPGPPDPRIPAYKGNFLAWQKAVYDWMLQSKGQIEGASEVNTRPIGPLVIATYTMITTITGTDDLSNFVATLVALMQGKGYTVPFDLRTTP